MNKNNWDIKKVGNTIELRSKFSKSDRRGKTPSEWHNVYSNLLIVVSLGDIDHMENCNMLMSLNGKCGLSYEEWKEVKEIVAEAYVELMGDKLCKKAKKNPKS
jgi:hypothetical protein